MERAAASWLLEQEARALLTRLAAVKPFALHETMVMAAALDPRALSSIEGYLLRGRVELRRNVEQFLQWLASQGRGATPEEMQRRFTIIRLQFNNVLSQFDLFTEVITQRSEHQTGVWLSGLDVLAADALAMPGIEVPQAVCYLARGPGAAIRRAHTRLPGGGKNPVAIIRVPRERMLGHGIGSSLIHEVGHQAAALLDLVPSLQPVLRQAHADAPPAEASAWAAWTRWISEIVADLWSVSRLGIGSTLGLIGVVSLPRWFVFRPNGDDPHPTPWIRVRVSCAIGQGLYPHPQWARLAELWASLYPPGKLGPEQLEAIRALEASMPRFVTKLLEHRPPALAGRSLREALALPTRRPDRLAAVYASWRRDPSTVLRTPPALAFAVLGHARATNQLRPEAEAQLLGRVLTNWAVRSSLDTSFICAVSRRRIPSTTTSGDAIPTTGDRRQGGTSWPNKNQPSSASPSRPTSSMSGAPSN